jgi:CRISPR-associated protein Csm5
MKKLFEIYELQITPLTPIHVGSGEELNPGEYFVFKDDSNKPVLYAADVGYLGSKLKPESRAALVRRISEKPIEWVNVVRQSKSFEQLVKRHARFQAYLTERVERNILCRWGKIDSRLGVQIMQRPERDAIIPGSSIKGAIRTALLWSAVKGTIKNFPTSDSDVAKWERLRLGARSKSIQDDPLRWLKVSDAVASGVRTWILDAEHVGMKTKNGEDAELQDYRECLPDPSLAEKTYTIIARLSIEVGHPAFAGCLSADYILKSCSDFYRQVIQSERKYWKGDDELLGIYEDLEQRLNEAPNGALIRLGWGSGMDAVSLNLAKPSGSNSRRGSNDDKYQKKVSTRRLLDGMPPGWALIKLVEV